MKMKYFLKENREEIDRVITDGCSNHDIDDEEREIWVMNDEYLYNLAISQGVNFEE